MPTKNQTITNKYALYCGDCCEVLPDIPSDSVGFSVFSPPFASLYSYTDDPRDLGNSKTYKEFFEHFDFVIRQLMRVLMPGRNVSIHCSDLCTFKRNGESIGLQEFPDDLVKAFKRKGFIYHSHHVIWKDPLIAATRTKAIGLAHKQAVKDSSMIRAGIPDEILTFRKPGDNPKYIGHPNGLTTYHGSRSIPKELDRYIGTQEQSKNKRSHWIWQQYASPVWFDIRQTKVMPYRSARAGNDEKHICPLQLDTIERCMALWSARGDVVLTPFMGVGSEVYVAVKNGRKALGIELKESYYKQALRNVQQALRARNRKGIGG
jgi:DNA modification methylase